MGHAYWYPLANPDVNQVFLPTASGVVALTACGISLLSWISYRLRQKWVAQGITHPFHIRIGINTGQASVGAFGSLQRLEYTAIGRQANLSARIQAHCPPDHVQISHSTWSLVHDKIACVAKGEADFQGSHEPVLIFEVSL